MKTPAGAAASIGEYTMRRRNRAPLEKLLSDTLSRKRFASMAQLRNWTAREMRGTALRNLRWPVADKLMTAMHVYVHLGMCVHGFVHSCMCACACMC